MMLLEHIPMDALKMILGIFLIVYALYALFMKNPLFPYHPITGGATGLVAGFFSSLFNIHGPIVGIYSQSNDTFKKKEIKDLIVTYMFFTGLFTVTGHIIAGRVNSDVLLYVLFSVPFILMGIFIGNRIFKKFNTSWVKRTIYIFIIAAGIKLII
jgi:uncharacterized membrane protein YfcA